MWYILHIKQKLREKGQGYGILVSNFPKDTSASYSLQEPDEASTHFKPHIPSTNIACQNYIHI